jgi:hypothetical protein
MHKRCFSPPDKPSAQLTDHRCRTLRKALNEIVGKGCLCRGNDLVFRGIGPAIGDIVAHRFIEQNRLLGDNGDLTARSATAISRTSMPSMQIRPAVTSKKRGIRLAMVLLPPPLIPTNANTWPWVDLQIDALENVLVAIAEMNIFKLHVVGAGRVWDGG